MCAWTRPHLPVSFMWLSHKHKSTQCGDQNSATTHFELHCCQPPELDIGSLASLRLACCRITTAMHTKNHRTNIKHSKRACARTRTHSASSQAPASSCTSSRSFRTRMSLQIRIGTLQDLFVCSYGNEVESLSRRLLVTLLNAFDCHTLSVRTQAPVFSRN